MTNHEKLAVLCGLSALAFGCNQESQREPEYARNSDQTYEGGEVVVPMTPASRTRSAAEQIAQARCQRELKCGNVGDNKTFSSTQDCLARIQSEWKDDLNSRQCRGGINQQEMDECMSEIKAEDCGNPFDKLARITECTQSQICVEQP